MNVAKLQGTEGTEGSADLIKINRGIDINKNLLDPLKYVRWKLFGPQGKNEAYKKVLFIH